MTTRLSAPLPRIRCERRYTCVLVCVGLTSFAAAAETLKADAILCETESPIALLSQSELANQPGSTVMKRVAAMVQSYALQEKMNQILLDLANQERSIWQDSRTPNRGATSSRAAEARAEQQKAAEASTPYKEFASRCVATPPQAQPLTVLERRPISRGIRVRTTLRGAEHNLWTHESYVEGTPQRSTE
jgi:hypothetical protein